MKWRLLFSTTLVFCIIPLTVFCQNKQLDSLMAAHAKAENDTNRIDILNALALALADQSAKDSSYQRAKQALELSKKIGYKKGLADAQMNISIYNFSESRMIEARKNVLTALNIFETLKDKPQIVKAHSVIAATYLAESKPSEALNHNFIALRLAEESGEKSSRAGVHLTMGAIYRSLNDKDEAMKHYVAARELLQEAGSKSELATINNEIGTMYFEVGRYSEALIQLKDALILFESLGEKGNIGSCRFWIGNVFVKQGEYVDAAGDKAAAISNYKNALENYKASLKHCKEVGDKTGMQSIYVGLGTAHLRLNNLPEAGEYLDKAFELSKEIGIGVYSTAVYLALSQVDSARGNFRQAYEHYKKYILHSDSMTNAENVRMSEQLKMRYKVDKKEDQIKLLSIQNKLKTILASKERQGKHSAYVAIASVLLLGGYGSYRYRIKKKMENQQALMNERLRISRELHDEVGATLSGIALYSHLAKEQIKNYNNAEVEKSLNIMQQSAGEMVNKLNDIVWLVNPEQDSLEMLLKRLEEYATDMALVKDMQVKVSLPLQLSGQILPVEARRNVFLFCKEAINNAIKHSEAALLELTVQEVDDTLEFSIKDNGKGFDVSMAKRGNGLNNLQKRAEEVGGKLLFQSRPNEGCVVSLRYSNGVS